jgi:hypothetical protein
MIGVRYLMIYREKRNGFSDYWNYDELAWKYSEIPFIDLLECFNDEYSLISEER